MSIIIAYHNETLRTLLRTIYSIVSRTPATNLQEIILIDDYSEDGKVNYFVPHGVASSVFIKISFNIS